MSELSDMTPAEARRLFDLAMAEDEEIKTEKRTPIETERHRLGLSPQDPLPTPRPPGELLSE